MANLRSTLVALTFASFIGDSVQAQYDNESPGNSTSAESVAALVAQLGDDRFQTRVTAQQRLLEIATAEPARTQKELRSTLAETTDPEVEFRLRSLLRTIRAIVPIQQITFSEAGVKDETWQMLKPPETASFSIKDGVLEYDSREKAEEAVMFVHHLEKVPTSNRLILEAEVRVFEERRVRDGLAGVHLNIEDGSSSRAMMIQDRGVFAYRTGRMHAMDTTDDWHHYRMVIEGPLQQLFVDDMSKPIIELRRPGTGGRYWISFGDGTAGAGAQAQIRNVTFSRFETEPASN